MEDVAAIAATAFAATPECDFVHLGLPTAERFATSSNQTLLISHNKSCKAAHDVNAELQMIMRHAAALQAENAQVREQHIKIECQSCFVTPNIQSILNLIYSCQSSVGKPTIHCVSDWMRSGDTPSAASMA